MHGNFSVNLREFSQVFTSFPASSTLQSESSIVMNTKRCFFVEMKVDNEGSALNFTEAFHVIKGRGKLL